MFRTLGNQIRKFAQDLRGIAAVEFALIAPPLLLVTIGVFDYGMFLNHKMKLENVSRAAVEYVLQGGHIDNISSDVINAENLNIEDGELENLAVSAGYSCECADAEIVSCSASASICGEGDYRRRYLTVSLSMDYTPIAPYPGLPEVMNIRSDVRIQTK